MDDNPEQEVVSKYFPTEQTYAAAEQEFNSGVEDTLAEPITKGDLLSATQYEPESDYTGQDGIQYDEDGNAYDSQGNLIALALDYDSEGFDPYAYLDESLENNSELARLNDNLENLRAIQEYQPEAIQRAEQLEQAELDQALNTVAVAAESIARDYDVKSPERMEQIVQVGIDLGNEQVEALLAEGYSWDEVKAAAPQIAANALDTASQVAHDQAVTDVAMRKLGGRAQNIDWSNSELMNTGRGGAWRRVTGKPRI